MRVQVPESPPPGTVDGCLGQAWDEAGEGHSAAPASSDGEGARKMVRGESGRTSAGGFEIS